MVDGTNGFQRARTDEQIESRRAEILHACANLYHEGSIEDVTIKAIAEHMSFSRPTIYNYYRTKEEILLDLLRLEYAALNGELQEAFARAEKAGVPSGEAAAEVFCRIIVDAFAAHDDLLRLQTHHLVGVEDNSRDENLAAFKRVLAQYFSIMDEATGVFFPGASEEARKDFMYMQFSMITGLYPVTHPTSKQAMAMATVGMDKAGHFEELCYKGLVQLAKGLL